MLNPLRSEAEAFRLLIYVLVVALLVVGCVLLFRALF
jgi:predicted nucleic acid-binding Zn ribbon protein